MPTTARGGLAAVALNGKIYAIGGENPNILSTVEEYTPETNSWRSVTSMRTARRMLAAVALNGKLYAIGGWDGSKPLNTVEEYTPETNTWRAVTSMPTYRAGLAAAVLNSKLYAIGGGHHDDILNTVEEYTPEKDSWRLVEGMPTARWGLAAATVNGKIYTIGGGDAEYTPETNSWRLVEPIFTARYGFGAVTFNGKIYAMGGGDGTGAPPYNIVEEYTPPRASEVVISPRFSVGTPPRYEFPFDLFPGTNLISLGLKPEKSPYMASDLAAELGATFVIRLDANDQYLTFVPAVGIHNFELEGGRGYIVHVLEEKTFTLKGTSWGNPVEPSAAPSPPTSPSIWAFAVGGVLKATAMPSPLTLRVQNRRTGATATQRVTDRFALALVDPRHQRVVEVGDVLELTLADAFGEGIGDAIAVPLNSEHLRTGTLRLDLPAEPHIPRLHQLLQNYPNPFNPETWIPYQLAVGAEVVIEIYDAAGAFVRRLSLGHQPAGFYLERGRAAYWDGRNANGERVASGIYFVKMYAGGEPVATRRMVIVK